LVHLGLAAVTLAVYHNALPNEFTFDDRHAILENETVTSPSAFLELWTTDYWGPKKMGGRYRPITSLTFAATYRLVGPNPHVFHLINVLLHLLVVFVVYHLCGRLLRDTRHPGNAALTASVLFAIHPVFTECVSSVVGRAEVLMTLFYLLGLASGLTWFDRIALGTRWPRGPFLVCLVCYALSLLSKENGVSLPLALIALWSLAVRDQGPVRVRLKSLLPLVVGLALVLSAYLALRYHVFGTLGLKTQDFEANPLRAADLATRLATALYLLGRYLLLFCFPVTLSAEYTYNQIPLLDSLWDPRHLLTLSWLALAAIALANRRRHPLLAAAVALYLIAMLPVSNLLYPIGTIFAERLLYLPGLAFVLLAAHAHGVVDSCRARPARIAAAIGAIGLFGLLGYRTDLRNLEWRDHLSLFKATVAASPMSARSHLNLGLVYWEQKDYRQALAEIDRSLEIYHRSANAHLARGKVLMAQRRFEEARAAFAEGERVDPKVDVAPLFHGEALLALHRPQEASAAFRRAIDRGLKWSDPWKHLANLSLARAPDRAEEYFRKALAIGPLELDVVLGLATALFQQGKTAAAVKLLERASERFPNHPQVQFNLAVAYASGGTHRRKAIELLRAAEPRSPPVIQQQIRALLQELGSDGN
jgi:tetratricopeptide (TPR) repeat protein